MGVADSPLRDRVIFVEGAPRSGTTLLAALLSSHPDVAGIASESHLFDRGVGALFDNYEGAGFFRAHLAAFVDRQELVDLARDLCDRVLEKVRSQTKPGARFVLEKTPAVRESPRIPLSRKLECYPDAWYLHIVRDREEVTRSLMRAPWNDDPSRKASERWWHDGVDAVREVLAERPRYREVAYGDLAGDPRAVMAELFSWLGLTSDSELIDRIALVAGERFASLRPGRASAAPEIDVEAVAEPQSRPDLAATSRRALRDSALGRLAQRAVRALRARRPLAVGNAFAVALQACDAAALERLTAPSLGFSLRSGDGDLRAEGDRARAAILAASQRVFGRRFLNQQWMVGGRDSPTLLFSGLRPAGTRVDLACNLTVRGGRVTRVSMLAVGSLDGRPLRDWSPDDSSELAEPPTT